MAKKPDIVQFDDRLARVYTTDENKEQQYDKWASTYESDLVDDMGYVAHKDASELFHSIVSDKRVNILDVACGTGLVGEYLLSLGYKNIDGVDFSGEMIGKSRDREVYKTVWQHDFTQPVDLQDYYDALICVGLFSFTIPKIQHIHNVVNCVKPGGHCVITVNGSAWSQLNLAPEVDEEAETHGFTIEQIVDAEYIRKEGIDAKILVITR